MHKKLILLSTAIIVMALPAIGDDCLDWFKGTGIKPAKDICLVDCSIAPVDMGDFMCRDRCDEFCKVSQAKETLFKLSDLYPGLTSAERALAAEDPAKALGAYRLSWKAEELCHNLYAKSKTNDASDACRHFIWAGLLTNSYGKDYALKILNAHEQDLLQPKESLPWTTPTIGLVYYVLKLS
ncbi:MAG: hypothetical protein OM95_11440 [Bdellovibrio sp. ArHS]|uniref:DUF6973 domain-containing protein n=1 Tax=Bdellovibrio sp. ArHS TaxID=1569284 RepID=UPI000583B685|nr:hypothetical protein [Bdellovibrio sp. ArHS]KHD87887.1 MAG: hypothetical protein OM95_11440 [Bdellovibrio sp. ArHS]